MLHSILLDRKVVVKNARRRQRKRRFAVSAAGLMLALVAVLAWHFGTGGSSQPQRVDQLLRQPPDADGEAVRSITDGVLRVPVPHGGTGSINPGFQEGRPVAWILVGNFRFPADWGARHQEGMPTVPSDGILLVVGDFISDEYSSDWPSVQRLHLPSPPRASHLVSWNVRFAGRALRLSVQFGSVPDERRRALANALLAGIRRVYP
jgi:hypothetical protein